MAKSGTFNTNTVTRAETNYTIRTYFQFQWTATENNQGSYDVAWTLTQIQTPTGESYYRTVRNRYVTIDGSTTSATNSVTGHDGTVVLSGTKTIESGKTFSVSVGVGVGQTTYNCTGNSTFTLDEIPNKVSVKVNDAWLTGTPYIKVNDEWKKVTKIFVKVNDEWKQSI